MELICYTPNNNVNDMEYGYEISYDTDSSVTYDYLTLLADVNMLIIIETENEAPAFI